MTDGLAQWRSREQVSGPRDPECRVATGLRGASTQRDGAHRGCFRGCAARFQVVDPRLDRGLAEPAIAGRGGRAGSVRRGPSGAGLGGEVWPATVLRASVRWAVPCLKVLVLPWRLYLTGHRGFRNEVWHPLRSWSLVARLVYAFLQSISAGWGMRRRTAIVLRPWLAIGPDGCVVVNGCREPDAVNTRGAAMSKQGAGTPCRRRGMEPRQARGGPRGLRSRLPGAQSGA